MAELRPRYLQRRHVEVVDRVQPAGDEGALAPVDDLPAQAQLGWHPAECEAVEPKRVQQARIAADHALRVVRERNVRGVVIHDLEVIESGAAHEDAGLVAVVERELRDACQRLGERGLLQIVQIAVIDVGGVAAATVGDGDQPAIWTREPPALAVADGGVPAEGPVAGLALETDGVSQRRDAGGQQGGARCDGQPRTAPRVNFPHVFSPHVPWAAELTPRCG